MLPRIAHPFKQICVCVWVEAAFVNTYLGPIRKKESGSSLREAICRSAFWQRENRRRELIKEAEVCSPEVPIEFCGFQLSPCFQVT